MNRQAADVPVRSLCLVIAVFPALGACNIPFDAELLQVQTVAPSRIEPGVRLRLGGEGFPAGRPATVAFAGTFRRPGRTPVPVEVRVRGRAVADDRIEVRVTERLVRSFGGRGTFAGDVRLSFATALGGGRVSGRLGPVEIDVLPDAAARLAQELARAREARRLFTLAGIGLAHDEAGAKGLRVSTVAAGSIAERAGIRPADRLVALDGVRLAAESDFVPSPSAGPSLLRIERAGDGASFQVPLPLPLGFRKAPLPSRSLVWLIVGSAVLAWLLLFVAPSARATAWLVRRRRRDASSRASPSDPRPLRALVEVVVTGFALVAFALACRAGDGAVSAAIIVALYLGLRAGAWLLTNRNAGGMVLATSALPACVLVTAVTLLVGSDRVASVVASQQVAPWTWWALRHPAGAVLLVPWLASLRPILSSGPRAAVAADRAAQLLLAGLGCALLLGGWAAGPLGLAGFVVKGWLVLSLARRAGVQRPADHVRWSAPLSLLALAGAVMAALDLWPQEIETACGAALSAGLGLLLVHVVLSRVRRPRPPPLELHPFL